VDHAGPLANLVEVTTEEGAAGAYTHVYTGVVASPNQAPYTPADPIPADLATGVPVTQTLHWQGGDPDGDPVTYIVAFVPSDPPPFAATTALTAYTPALAADTTYYWTITATDGLSESVGPRWVFTTTLSASFNRPPHMPANPIPADGAKDVPLTQTLHWQGGDPDGDPVTYTVAFGTSTPPPFAATTPLTSYTPSLITDTTYYWAITGSDGISVTEGHTWSFVTAGPERIYLPLVVRDSP
jgi:hypothetical protein